ncbi:11197_t:CDS:2 [Racocetra persica]|uniref:11197_t:CDS:1 n=1 Tax=Racocetra persica TaxID=160502 RepID=A0ACA9LQI8_9GLOM|nr:11197_t:CDS:2 [Racocetra persica]
MFAKEKLIVIHYLEQSKSICADLYIEKLYPRKKANFPELEEDLAAWIKETRDQRNAVTCMMVIQKAKSFAQQPRFQILYPNINQFGFSRKCLDAFMSHYDLSNRRRTNIAQYLPADLIEKQQ